MCNICVVSCCRIRTGILTTAFCMCKFRKCLQYLTLDSWSISVSWVQLVCCILVQSSIFSPSLQLLNTWQGWCQCCWWTGRYQRCCNNSSDLWSQQRLLWTASGSQVNIICVSHLSLLCVCVIRRWWYCLPWIVIYALNTIGLFASGIIAFYQLDNQLKLMGILPIVYGKVFTTGCPKKNSKDLTLILN